ncbi:MAG: hypothetical protein JETCAE03_32120 [Ignavibacteriaceae bacterium]|jgi:glycosyltransferase involved in cell wall biosynthesis|nr:MAG: hypothetical protein JETCAE03_32120 [Ignavibacteriaceae bacterium]
MQKISFIQPSRNNLKYLKWSYNSLRKNLNSEHEICVASDFSNDGTVEWCEETAKKDQNFKFIVNEGPTRLGHTILYDKLINEVATNEIVMIWHADMWALPNMDRAILEYIKPKTIVSATRIEPPLHPPGPEKIIFDAGIEPEEFFSNIDKLLTYYHQNLKDGYNGIETTEGVFAPWAIYKKDFQEIGGHDPLFAPQSKEDSDIFNRLLLNGCKFIQTWKGFVYHMTCRGSRFKDGAKRNPDGQVFMAGRETEEWLAQNQRSTRNFIRKWGSFVKHDELMLPVVPHKYDIGIVAIYSEGTPEINEIARLEPYCNCLYIKSNYDANFIVDKYIELESRNTKYNLRERVKLINNLSIKLPHDIVVTVKAREITQYHWYLIQQLPEILADSGEIGEMQLDIFNLKINSLNTYERNLIFINREQQ